MVYLASALYVGNFRSRAMVRGQDLGEMGPLPEQAHLGDFWVPQQGRFFIGQAFLEPYDPARHLAVFSQESQAA